MTSLREHSLNDSYPPGWVLTYLVSDPPGPSIRRMRIGVVAGPAVHDLVRGGTLIPLAALGAGRGRDVETVWIRDTDVIGIDPRPPVR